MGPYCNAKTSLGRLMMFNLCTNVLGHSLANVQHPETIQCDFQSVAGFHLLVLGSSISGCHPSHICAQYSEGLRGNVFMDYL